MENEGNLDKIYRVYADEDGVVVCPECNTAISPDDEYKYELLDFDGTCCRNIFSINIKCLKCKSILEIF